MTISNQNLIAIYNGNDSTVNFPTLFVFENNSEVNVILRDAAGVETTQVESTNYTLTGGGQPPATGTVTMNVAPATGEELIIERDMPYTQAYDYVEGDSFPAASHENALDRMIMTLQQLAEKVGRSLIAPFGTTADLAVPDPQAGYAIGWNSTEDGMINLVVDSGDAIGAAQYTEVQTATVGQTIFTLVTSSFNPGTGNLVVYVNGVRQHPAAYAESAPSTVTFTEGLDAGDEVLFSTGELISTITIPNASAVPYTPSATRTVADKLNEVVSVKDFGAVGDGVTDDATSFSSMITALSNGDYIYIPTGTYLLGSGINFTQDKLKILCSPGAVFKQADGTRSIDTLIECSGDRGYWEGGEFFANIANNGTYTGRGESLKISGDYWRTDNTYFNESHDNGFSAGLYVTGSYGTFKGITSLNTKNAAVRNAGTQNRFYIDSMVEFEQNGFLSDNGPAGASVEYTYVNVRYAKTTSVGDHLFILFDHDGVQDGSCEVEIGYAESPNITGADMFKFAYMKNVTLRGFRGTHKNTLLNTVRFQQSIDRVVIDDCIFPAAINFDATTECEMLIKGNTVIGDTIAIAAAVQDVAGTLTIEDGCSLKNLTSYAITTDSGYPNTKVNIGRVHYDGASGTPAVCNHTPYSGTIRRLQAGLITVQEPLSTTGTMKNLPTDGRWIGTQDIQDAACVQGEGGRVFLVGNSDFPPREVESHQRGDIIRRRAPSASDTPAEYWCVTAGSGSSTTTAWASGQTYALGVWRTNSGNVYACSSAITTSGTAPTGTGTGIVDGDGAWDYVDTVAVFKGVSSISA